MGNSQNIIDRANKVLIGNYARQPIVMDRGAGSDLWDAEGKEYLDLFAGFGGCILGHCHPAFVAAATEQAGEPWDLGDTDHTEARRSPWGAANRPAASRAALFCH